MKTQLLDAVNDFLGRDRASIYEIANLGALPEGMTRRSALDTAEAHEVGFFELSCEIVALCKRLKAQDEADDAR